MDKTDSKHIDFVTKDLLDADLDPNKTNIIAKSSEEAMVQENAAIESESVLMVDIKDESTVDMTDCDTGAFEMSEMEIVPVIEFIDIKKEGVKEEVLVQKKSKQNQAPQRCKR